MFISAGHGVSTQLLQQERVFQNALDGFDHVRLKCRRVLLLGIPGQQEVSQSFVSVCTNTQIMRASAKGYGAQAIKNTQASVMVNLAEISTLMLRCAVHAHLRERTALQCTCSRILKQV